MSLSKNISPSLILVQPRYTRPFITERVLMGRKESNQTNNEIVHILIKQNNEKEINRTFSAITEFNSFMHNVFSHPYQFVESISNFRVVGWCFSFLFKF